MAEPDTRVRILDAAELLFTEQGFEATTLRRLTAAAEGGGRPFRRLLGRTYTKPSEFVRGFLAEEYAAVIARFKAALIKALPGVPGEEILWRFHFMLGAMSYALSGTDALHIVAEDALDDDDAEGLYARLMSFMLGGLRAPLPALPAKSAKSPRIRKT